MYLEKQVWDFILKAKEKRHCKTFFIFFSEKQSVNVLLFHEERPFCQVLQVS